MSKLIIDVSTITNHQFDVFVEFRVRDHGHPEDGCAHRVADVNQLVTTRHSHDVVQRSGDVVGSDFVPPVINRSQITRSTPSSDRGTQRINRQTSAI